jgi:DNA polymerase III subunit gamma/tau
MSYQVLARKLRPATFDALVGQDHVVRALRNALDSGRLHHAYLFTGTRGVGKTTIARVLAKCLNCERGVSSTPCGECAICREVAENRFVDLIEVDAASRTKVDDTRDLLENAQYLPARGRYKVYLIDEVHMLSTHSFNALLKTLEEPPEHVKFLLATTEARKVPITVLSRCLQFQLKNLSVERISSYLAGALEGEGIDYEPDALQTIAAAARGSMRDALSITDQAIAFGEGALRAADVVQMLGLVGRDQLAAVIDALAAQDAARVVAVTAELAEQAVDFSALLAELIGALHQMAVQQAIRGAGGRDGPATPLPAEVVQLYYQIALLGYRDLQFAPDPQGRGRDDFAAHAGFLAGRGGHHADFAGSANRGWGIHDLRRCRFDPPAGHGPAVLGRGVLGRGVLAGLARRGRRARALRRGAHDRRALATRGPSRRRVPAASGQRP